jgi:methionyl-tRNA formyltransferase
MRILVIGQAAFGQDIFNHLRDAGEEVVAVAAPAQSLSGRADRLRAAADADGVLAVETSTLRDPQVQARLRDAAPDIGVMVYVSDLIPVEVLNLPTQGTIQYHPSLLPKHRGRSSINWAIIQGDRETGVSIFWPDEGWDTGPILMQRAVEIGPDDTTGSLYYDKLYPMGIEMILESVKLVAQGNAPKIAQDHTKATYEKPAEDPLIRIDWRRPAAEIYNLIRGNDPSPGAWTRHEGNKVRITDARLLSDQRAAPGVVASVSDEGIVVGGNGGSVLARKLGAASGPAVPAHDFAKAQAIRPGVRFLNPKLQT